MLSRHRDEPQWCLRIDRALEDSRFVLYHQLIAAVDHVEGDYSHTELLIRMLDEEGQIISPMTFIPAAERYHRMPRIDSWVVLNFLADTSLHQGDSKVVYNINLSGVKCPRLWHC